MNDHAVTSSGSPFIYIDFLNHVDMKKLYLINDEIIAFVETGLAMQGKGDGN
jgi:hypothetical protein